MSINRQQESLQHELIKELLKQAIQSNSSLTDSQKQVATHNLDRAAKQADWIVNMMRACGYLK
ncbi:MAG: hypothetical protein IJH92_06125 [Mogibacterium sp.]|nr:hypothetical protein [Mogibacterium sp.]